jgi:hypothetical protein
VTDLPRTAGRAVAVPLGALARRRRGKPMHPRGTVLDAVLQRTGGPAGWRVPWLAGSGDEAALVRLSRGAGLPTPLPDLLGLAVRIPDGPVDLLLSTTGTAPLLRQVPVLRRRPAAAYTSTMGYRTDGGTLRLAALPDRGARRFTLAAARGQGPWRPFGRLVLGDPRGPLDPDVRFDAVRNPPHGLVPDGPMARFRAPAYAAARAGRDASPPV